MRPRGLLPRTLFVCASLVFLLSGLTSLSPVQAVEEGQGPEDGALRDYLSANGMLSRGLYELSATEYRKFLSEHGAHEKAPVARYGLAVSLFRLKQYEPAAEELDQLAKLRSFEYAAEVAMMLGQCRAAAKQYGPAAAAYEMLLERYGDHELADDAAAGLVEALYLDGKHDSVAAKAEGFLPRWVQSPLAARVHYFVALSLMARLNYAEAADRWDSVLRENPDGPLADQAKRLRAQCREQSEFERGRTLFDGGDFEAAQASFEKVAAEPGEMSDDAAYWAAKCLLRREKFAEAAGQFAAAARKYPDSDLQPEMTYDGAIGCLRAGKTDCATRGLAEFMSRFAEHPLAPEALRLLAVTEHRAGHNDESTSRCREFLERFPKHVHASSVAFLVAENDFLSERYEAAADGYRRFLDKFKDDPQSRAAQFRLGMALYHLKRGDEAVEWLERASASAETDEAYRPALLALGDLFFQRGEWKDAERRLSTYLSLDKQPPSADDALLKLGLALQRQGLHQQAIESYDRLIADFPKSPHRTQALFERGQVLLALDKRDEAAKAFEAVVDEGSDERFTPHALNHLGSLAQQRQEFEKAAEYFDRVGRSKVGGELESDSQLRKAEALMAAGEFGPAEEALARFLAGRPEGGQAVRAQAQRAIALSRLGQREGALRLIENLSPKDLEELTSSLRGSVSYEKAWCLCELERIDEAKEAYRAVIAVGDSAGSLTAHATLELAELEAAAKRFEEAAALLRRLDARSEGESSSIPAEVREQAGYRLAVCDFELGRFEESARRFEDFMSAFPTSSLGPSARLFAGEAFLKLGRHEQAVKYLEQIAERHRSDPAYGPGLLRLGECLAAQQKWPRSEQVFSEYLERFAQSELAHQARFGIGWARENQSRWDEAIAGYREVVAHHQGPTAARAQFQIGECLFAQKQYEDAARELLKVDILYAYPEWSAAALYEAGRCFEKLSKSAEARAQFRAVQEKYPDSPWAKKSAEQLAASPTEPLPGR